MIKWIKKRLNRIRPQEEELPEIPEPVEVQQNEVSILRQRDFCHKEHGLTKYIVNRRSNCGVPSV